MTANDNNKLISIQDELETILFRDCSLDEIFQQEAQDVYSLKIAATYQICFPDGMTLLAGGQPPILDRKYENSTKLLFRGETTATKKAEINRYYFDKEGQRFENKRVFYAAAFKILDLIWIPAYLDYKLILENENNVLEHYQFPYRVIATISKDEIIDSKIVRINPRRIQLEEESYFS